MKGLKKIALATAVAAAPFAANADLKALDDSAMGNVTGQAGVTIELETKVSIGQFKYTDEGSFAVNDIVLGGAGVTAAGSTAGYNDLLDQLKIDIDVLDDGDAKIHVGTLDGNPIDWGMTVGSMELLAGNTGSDSTTLISNLSGWGNLAQLDIAVDTATDHLNVVAAFDVQDMDFDVEFLGIGIRDLTISGAGGNFDYDGDGSVMAADADGEFGLDPASQEAQVLAGFANVNLDVYKGAGLGASTAADVLRIDVNNVYMDVAIGETIIGGTNIGTIAIDNLAITDTKLAVYGH
ncbi:DUF6160 family protein [Marinobacter salsuginis]|uniref:DUF6160 domain-containing protein n=1 Tax=Marinobacter salsuginis TaxID=418719 RepID=A0A5M3PIJ5_9GAMM|nr:DUF6160 family protein [Marinobacter salsuginis]GBO82697.1 hypothetical protein MS5N3_01480 [Marinobacter salsuginis]